MGLLGVGGSLGRNGRRGQPMGGVGGATAHADNRGGVFGAGGEFRGRRS